MSVYAFRSGGGNGFRPPGTGAAALAFIFDKRARQAIASETKKTEAAAKTLGLEYHVEKISDLKQIMSFGVMKTPALVVDGQVKLQGRVLSAEKLKELIA